MERIRPVDTPPDDPDKPSKPERFSPYAVPLTTLMGGAFVATADQCLVKPDPVPWMDVPTGPEGGGGGADA